MRDWDVVPKRLQSTFIHPSETLTLILWLASLPRHHLCCACGDEFADCPTVKTSFRTASICTVSPPCAFSCAVSDPSTWRTLDHTHNTCKAFHQCGFVCAAADPSSGQTHDHIGRICTVTRLEINIFIKPSQKHLKHS